MKKIYFIIIWVQFFPTIAFTQKISGTIYDIESKKNIAWASVTCGSRGTVANENGKFEIENTSNEKFIEVSVIGYKKNHFSLTNGTDAYSVYMQPSIIELPEVIVSNYANVLVRKAYQKLNENKEIYFGKAYCREKTTLSDTNIVEFREFFFEKQLDNHEVNKIAVLNTRFAFKEHSHVTFNNVYNANKISIIQTADILKEGYRYAPIRENANDIFNFTLIGKNDENVAEIIFEPKEEYKNKAITGSLFIDITTYEVLHYRIDNTPVTLGKVIDGFHYENGSIAIDMYLKENRINKILLRTTFDMTKKGEKTQKQISDCILLIYEYGEKNKQLNYKPIEKMKNDILLQKIKYNPVFWKNNPVVKRTPLEENIIQFFEKEGIFSNINTED